MTKAHIVLIGAGSTSFGVNTLADLFHQRDHLRGSTIALCDVNAKKLSLMSRLAELMNAATGAPFHIESATDFRTLITGAEFVFLSVEVDRLDRWKLDWQIPKKYGYRHVLGENAGPGGLSHALRTISLTLGIAREIDRLAPDAYLINFTNPLSRVCLALSRHTRLKVVGMCHQINKGYYLVGHIFGLTPRLAEHFPPPSVSGHLKARFELKTAGLNHFTWVTDLRDRATGRDLYPEFRECEAEFDPSFEPFSRQLYHAFGLFPTAGDDHIGEFFSYASEVCDLSGYDFDGREQHVRELEARVERAGQPDGSIDDFLKWESGERGANVVAAISDNLDELEPTVNVVNSGALPGLPDWAIVEVPALVGAAGVMPLRLPPLPAGITAVLNQQVLIQDRVVEAAVNGDRQAALQALLLDPLTTSYGAAEKLVDELLATHLDYLPEFRARANGS